MTGCKRLICHIHILIFVLLLGGVLLLLGVTRVSLGFGLSGPSLLLSTFLTFGLGSPSSRLLDFVLPGLSAHLPSLFGLKKTLLYQHVGLLTVLKCLSHLFDSTKNTLGGICGV